MELRQLRCFLAVAEELHVALAAEKLHIEQSPLSRTIKELEEDLGEKLFFRVCRSTRLSRAGKLFLEHGPRQLATGWARMRPLYPAHLVDAALVIFLPRAAWSEWHRGWANLGHVGIAVYVDKSHNFRTPGGSCAYLVS